MKREIKYIGVSVGAIVINSDNKVLISKRTNLTRNQYDLWEFPGGGVEIFETREDAIKREFLEEFNIHIEITGTLEVYDYILEAEAQHWLTTTYLAKYVKGHAVNMEPSKSSEFKWIDFTDLQNYKMTKISQLNIESILLKNIILKY